MSVGPLSINVISWLAKMRGHQNMYNQCYPSRMSYLFRERFSSRSFLVSRELLVSSHPQIMSECRHPTKTTFFFCDLSPTYELKRLLDYILVASCCAYTTGYMSDMPNVKWLRARYLRFCEVLSLHNFDVKWRSSLRVYRRFFLLTLENFNWQPHMFDTTGPVTIKNVAERCCKFSFRLD